jgi:alkylation response protein AidB-like acyl-CoA dehydrogenase
VSLSPDERDELRSVVRDLLLHESPSDRVRAVVADDPGFDRALWNQMAELGWSSVHVPARFGGGGAGYAELAIVLHELGRLIVPAPFLASAVLATSACLLAGDDALAGEMLESLVAGEILGSAALAATDGSYDSSRLTTRWERVARSVRLRGAAGFVLDADVADMLVVAARGTDSTVAVVVVETAAPGVRVERVPTVDSTRRLFTVTFTDVVVGEDRMLCEPGAAAEAFLARMLAVGVIAAACDATGAAERVLERAAEYARERNQFGKPIGTFQAVKHHCANMAIEVHASRAAVSAASGALDGDATDWPTRAAVTSSYVGPACSDVCALGLKVHGGIGFTWEHDSHLYLKRAKLDEVLFGTPSWHRRRLGQTLVDDVIGPTGEASPTTPAPNGAWEGERS